MSSTNTDTEDVYDECAKSSHDDTIPVCFLNLLFVHELYITTVLMIYDLFCLNKLTLVYSLVKDFQRLFSIIILPFCPTKHSHTSLISH